MYTFGHCQRPVSSLCVSEFLCKITNKQLKKNNTLAAKNVVLSDAWEWLNPHNVL